MRVLLIEDDSATAQSIELMLKSESFYVYTTDLGEEGGDLGKLYDYDIILLDLNVPPLVRNAYNDIKGIGRTLPPPRIKYLARLTLLTFLLYEFLRWFRDLARIQ